MTEDEPGVVEMYEVLIFWAATNGGSAEKIRATQSNVLARRISFILPPQHSIGRIIRE
jgi:hypothetical protein